MNPVKTSLLVFILGSTRGVDCAGSDSGIKRKIDTARKIFFILLLF
jgi:hypothetical protein